MELTAKTLHEVTFGAKVRGYDPAEVDDFIAAVAEGVEELQTRLSRATERAVRAEQEAAASTSASSSFSTPAPAPVAAPSSSEISKVWERAAFAAEAAVEEAKQEAARMLEEAQGTSERQLADAREKSESLVSNAREEAVRIANEAQGQLRAEITQLEQAREQLQQDVSGLSHYVDSSLNEVRATLTRALSTLDEHGSGATSLPEVGEVQVPPAPFSDEANNNNGDSNYSPAGEPASHGHVDQSWQQPEAAQHEQQDSWSASEPANAWPAAEPENAWPVEEAAQASWPQDDQPAQAEAQPAEAAAPWAEHANTDWQQPQEQPAEGEQDPFLAELRRAVQDDGPLGPRDEGDGGIDHLYADDGDDDKSSFFRRKK